MYFNPLNIVYVAILQFQFVINSYIYTLWLADYWFWVYVFCYIVRLLLMKANDQFEIQQSLY